MCLRDVGCDYVGRIKLPHNSVIGELSLPRITSRRGTFLPL
jgi:hypothetical protein